MKSNGSGVSGHSGIELKLERSNRSGSQREKATVAPCTLTGRNRSLKSAETVVARTNVWGDALRYSASSRPRAVMILLRHNFPNLPASNRAKLMILCLSVSGKRSENTTAVLRTGAKSSSRQPLNTTPVVVISLLRSSSSPITSRSIFSVFSLTMPVVYACRLHVGAANEPGRVGGGEVMTTYPFPSKRSWYRRDSLSVSPFFRTTR